MYNSEDMQNLINAIDLFIPGMNESLSIIKYERINPDFELLCFRTYGRDNNTYYFSLIHFDHMNTITYGKKVINKSFAKVIEFIPPHEKQKGRTELEQKSVSDRKRGYPAGFLLARTERPKGVGYWATDIIIRPNDDIHEKVRHLSDVDRPNALAILVEVLKSTPPASLKKDPSDFLGGWTQKANRATLTPETVIINDTNLVISVYKNIVGDWEAFFKHQHPENKI